MPARLREAEVLLRRSQVQRGRSKRGGETYSVQYVEPPSAARTKLADFFNILLGIVSGDTVKLRTRRKKPCVAERYCTL